MSLGQGRLGESRLGEAADDRPTVDQEASVSPVRQRFYETSKSAFPTEPGLDNNWDRFYNTLSVPFDREHQLIEEEIRPSLYIDTASGGVLDKRFGRLLQLPRESGETDPQYRRRLKLEIPKYIRGATINDILYLTATLLNCSPTELELVEQPRVEPAAFGVQVDEIVFANTDATQDEFERNLQKIKAAGVRAYTLVGQQFTHRSIEDLQNDQNNEDQAYGVIDDQGVKDPDAGGPYAGRFSRGFTPNAGEGQIRAASDRASVAQRAAAGRGDGIAITASASSDNV